MSSVKTNQPISGLHPLEISPVKHAVVNIGTINSENDDQQCTGDIGEHSPTMGEQPIRNSTAKGRQSISCWKKEIFGPAPDDFRD